MYRRIALIAGSDRRSVEAVVVGITAGRRRISKPMPGLTAGARAMVEQALSWPEVTGKRGEITPLRDPSGQRVLLVGLGEGANLTTEALRIAAARALRWADAAKVARLELLLTDALNSEAPALDQDAAGRAIGDGLALAGFEFKAFKGTAGQNGNGGAKTKDAHAKAKSVDTLAVRVAAELRAGVERSLVIGEGVSLARSLAATPPNVANPSYLVKLSREMAARTGLTCKVIDAAGAKKLGMGGLLAVGAAGSTPPALICLEYRPKGRAGKARPVMLVGKAVTFDTGGYSIKPAENMDKMKYDKCGGMAVLGAMHAIARLKPAVPVVGLIPTAENMVAAEAYRPGDILTLCNGVTVEITNTDAEGRLILADALAYGCKTYQPAAAIDLATLTGGVIVALGTSAAGLFSTTDGLRDHLMRAASFTGEKLWPLPLWDEHRELLKGTHGDLVNSGGREAHPIQGAAFLSYFANTDGSSDPGALPRLPWAHLDIAGMADVKRDTPLYPTGPTGYGVRLLVRAVETWSDAAAQ